VHLFVRHLGGERRKHYISLFWRLFIPNATVLTVACVVLLIEPANGRVLVLAGGLTALLITNVLLMRRAFEPLDRLGEAMASIDPLAPGQRISMHGPESEVTLLTTAFNEMLNRLERERRESALRAQSAQEDERRRLAGELHDEIGQSLTALTLELRRIADAAPPDLRDDVLSARRFTSATLDDVRRLARELRPEALDQLGLVAALASLCKRFSEHSGLSVDCSLERELPPLGEDAELVIYRVAQESLTNAARHAAARRARVELSAAGGGAELRVEDDGTGFRSSARGSGIRGMRERALLIGAELSLGDAEEGGARVVLRVPVEEGR